MEEKRKWRGCAIEKMNLDGDGHIVIKCHDFIKDESVSLVLTDAQEKQLRGLLDKDK